MIGNSTTRTIAGLMMAGIATLVVGCSRSPTESPAVSSDEAQVQAFQGHRGAGQVA